MYVSYLRKGVPFAILAKQVGIVTAATSSQVEGAYAGTSGGSFFADLNISKPQKIPVNQAVFVN